MSNRFNGFTQDEICMINSKSEPVRKSNSGTVRKHALKKMPIDSKIIEKLPNSKQNNAIKDATSSPPTVDTTNLSDSTVQALHDALHYQRLDSQQRLNNPTESHPIIETNDQNGNDHASIKQNNNYMYTDENVADDGKRSLFQGISLKDFEKHQQMMKEANLEKRKLLSQAIEQRFEQSIAEATKIAKIRDELDKLDQELATDVEILRKEIEAVTLQYKNTQELYHQVETQFLAAKLSLHQVSEKKEMLTEHLCTIISHNEDRKAKKLSELLNKVGLNSDCPPSDADQNVGNTTNTN